MIEKFRNSVRSFLGVEYLKNRLVEILTRHIDEEGIMIRGAIRESEKAPALATVTILCKTLGDGGKTTTTTHGGEAFVAPGASHTLKLEYSQRTLGSLTYFLSGHPNLVITSFQVGNQEKKSSWAGTKYGECDAVVEVGQLIQIRIEYRVEGQNL